MKDKLESESSSGSESEVEVVKIRAKRKRFSFGKLITIGTVLLFGWFVTNWLLQIYMFFEPFTYIPYYTKKITVPESMYYYPNWESNQLFRFDAYYSTSKNPNKVFAKNNTLLCSVISSYGSFDEKVVYADFNLPKSTLNNGSLYFHAFLYDVKKSPNPSDKAYDSLTLTRTTKLTKYHKTQFNTTHSLLGDQEDKRDPKVVKIEKMYKDKILTHIKPFVQVEMVLDYKRLPYGHIPADVVPDLVLLNNKKYLPFFYINEIGLRNEHLRPVIKELSSAPNITITFKRTKFGLYRIYNHFNQIFSSLLNNRELPIKVSEKDIDNFRQMFFETSPILLMATFLASFFHMLFEFLAFKSDIQHYRKNTHTFNTVSKSSLILNAVTHTFSFLFLFEKMEETSRLVLFGAAASALLEFWKLLRVYTFKSKEKRKANSKEEKQSNENKNLDKAILKYTLIFSIPVTIAYSLYNLFYKEYKSVYSWVLEFMMAFIYLLGFVNMTPQIILNYKNKSVEGIPLKMFLFRAINTFIDDLFAFVIPMPNLTRLSMFRDDIVFIVFLYQWWKYPKSQNNKESHKKDD